MTVACRLATLIAVALVFVPHLLAQSSAFEKVGWSEQLLEEFGWRIEAIRQPSTGGSR
jgi:hypothetical protein